MDLDGLYKLVKQGNDFSKERFEYIEEFIKVQNTATRARVEEIHDSLKREINGQAIRTDKVEAYIEKDKKQKWMFSGAVAVIASALGIFWAKIFS